MNKIPAKSIVLVAIGLLTARAFAEDWGAYTIIPAGARSMALEAVGSGTEDGTAVSIGKPGGTPNQKWFITPKGDNFYTIKPSYSSTLVLSADKGGTKDGTLAVLETDQGQPWQLWRIEKSDVGTYSLIPKHAPDKGLDDLGGNASPGARQDLWTYNPKDTHLQWVIKPLAGSTTAGGTPETAPSAYVPPEIKPEDVPKGTTKEFTFSASTIFPGTVRGVTVFIPAQYDGSKPACVYVKTDGYNPREKAIMETMMATKEMP